MKLQSSAQHSEYLGVHLTSCVFLDDDQKATFHIAFFISSYVLPLILISGLYVRMISRLWRTVVGGNMSAESHRGRKRVTRLVVVVVAAFAFLWLPIQVSDDNWIHLYILNIYFWKKNCIKKLTNNVLSTYYGI